uniref:RNA polymerase beta'' subunit n=1 Tax=Erythrolobus coxiae TaxID=362235 RepID=UPI001FCD4BE2|nr:RNA polymerase beta'' subunit [Erythrolobus coxiae]UNJ17668.1 RNA polymerase beta'' subunit [Erythrolobus coxiae]
MGSQYTDTQLHFLNKVLDKKQLKKLISWVFRNYGIARAANMADQLKTLGFYFATKAGLSLSLEDLRIPPSKHSLLEKTKDIVKATEQKYYRGEITIVERFQKVIDTWNNASETLKQEVIEYFKETDPLNPIYIMAFSGARGNVSQVRQLVGMRGLMSDPQGQIIDRLNHNNFREGLTVTEYFISSYGARKGLVDTALRTADSGYLTRRLVDVAQDVIIREIDCQTERGILLEDMTDNNNTLIDLEHALVGRILAENIFSKTNNGLIAQAKQSIDSDLAKLIIESNIKKVLVRSPLTCEAHGSICQYCYGWNLAHGKLIDLGEAVGIIAAQSIGEPGTQLTMRTFHTGGVFTGELANQIYAPVTGTIHYDDYNDSLSQIRTSHGEIAMLVNNPLQITIVKSEEESQEIHKINLKKNDVLFFKKNTVIQENTIIAESPVTTRLSTEKAQKYLTTDTAGEIYFDDLSLKESNDEYASRIVENSGLVWIISGQVYDIPENAEICTEPNKIVDKDDILARIKLSNKFAGYVKIDNNSINKNDYFTNIAIITDCIEYSHIKLNQQKENNQNIDVLVTPNGHKFKLNIKKNSRFTVTDNEKIGQLVSQNYHTSTGGIIKFLNLSVAKRKTGKGRNGYDILAPGYMIWISEETHIIQKDVSLLLVKNGEYIEEGTEICKNIFCKNSGTVEIIKKDETVKEIIIKPGKIYPNSSFINTKEKKRGFLRPGEKLNDNLKTDKLIYWEYIDYETESYLLIRDVTVFSITEKTFIIGQEFTKHNHDDLGLSISIKTPFKDGERIKSINGVELVTIDLIVKTKNDNPLLNTEIEFPISNKKQYIRVSIVENLSFREANVNSRGNEYIRSRILVANGQHIDKNSIVAQTEIISASSGIVDKIPKDLNNNNRIMIVTKNDLEIITIDKSNHKLKINQWIKAGDEIAPGINAKNSGKITKVDGNTVEIRLARPYLISQDSILYINKGDLIQRGETLAMLIFQRKKTGDIVQGLPRIEEILEARKKSDNPLNPHELLSELFIFYKLEGLNLHDAARLSLQDIQQVLVNEIQVVYQSQNVDIADKHVEVIVRQMTSKVKIDNGGDSNYLPGELVDVYTIESVNRNLALSNSKMATYYPVLMGITKASLNTDSFISAASFQETTKVLTEAAIAGKLDWLKGLKENVIIGRLIPAGTGFKPDKNIDTY